MTSQYNYSTAVYEKAVELLSAPATSKAYNQRLTYVVNKMKGDETFEKDSNALFSGLYEKINPKKVSQETLDTEEAARSFQAIATLFPHLRSDEESSNVDKYYKQVTAELMQEFCENHSGRTLNTHVKKAVQEETFSSFLPEKMKL